MHGRTILIAGGCIAIGAACVAFLHFAVPSVPLALAVLIGFWPSLLILVRQHLRGTSHDRD
ncbi:hypothetical protein [Streptomyces sp. NPDC006274]|jgi:hypothetical protein|uniref:hypothetical protein n=1 Tax=unclassified Streptomyces TaxID=2593676 RepID=UPI00339DD4B5